MLEFGKLRTPRNDGETLVVPEARHWAFLTQSNSESLQDCKTILMGQPLAQWRRVTRNAVVGDADRPVVVTGHQPGFFHPGVWAKHIAAARFAEAIGGAAVDLVVDNDAAKDTTLKIPAPDARSVASVPFAHVPAGHTYEQIPGPSLQEIADFEAAVRLAMGVQYESSQMPVFISAAAGAGSDRDWVDRMVDGRDAIEKCFGVVVPRRRVSTLWDTPLLADMLLHAPEFRASYNQALKEYRRANGVRSPRRPIPDLLRLDDLEEVPLWLHRRDEPRHRAFVSRRGGTLRLFAEGIEVAVMDVSELAAGEALSTALEVSGGWALRPRALTLTTWARLLLADLFIHGIGGAKYDRISDAIMRDYYGVTPPQMVCVTATLRLSLPSNSTTKESVLQLRHTIRDMIWNPQRHLGAGDEVQGLLVQRHRAVQESEDLRRLQPHRHEARREVFERVRVLNNRLGAHHSPALATVRRRLADASDQLRLNQVSQGREYFFGLFDRSRLEQLAAALPNRRGFSV